MIVAGEGRVSIAKYGESSSRPTAAVRGEEREDEGAGVSLLVETTSSSSLAFPFFSLCSSSQSTR
jgi:hypothetical protein